MSLFALASNNNTKRICHSVKYGDRPHCFASVKVADQSPRVRRSTAFYQVQCVRRVLAQALFLLPSFYTSAAQSDAYVELNLSVTQTNFRSATATWSSRCVFGRTKWLIESHFSRNAVDYFYCDGTNVYKIARITHIPTDLPAILERFKSPSLTGQTNLPKATDPINLSIIPGIHPLADTGANLPWLAYCSGRYIRLTNQLIPLIVSIVRDNPWSFAFEHQEEVFSDDLGLPNKLSLVCSEKLLKKSPFDIRMRRNGDQVRSARLLGDAGVPLIEGMLAARYTVISSTNIAGWTIPTVLTYEQFMLGRNTLVPFLVATGIATDIHLAQEPQSIVTPSQSYIAIDYRFRSRKKLLDEIVYPITNGVVPAMSDPHVESLFKRAEIMAVLDPITKTGYGLYWLFSVFLAGPVIVISSWWLKTKDTNKRKGQS